MECTAVKINGLPSIHQDVNTKSAFLNQSKSALIVYVFPCCDLQQMCK